MTIEEKVRELILKQDIAAGYDKNGHARQERVEKFTKAILALIKPMSRERLYTIFAKTKGCKESLEDCSYKKCKASRTECELLADAILAERGKE